VNSANGGASTALPQRAVLAQRWAPVADRPCQPAWNAARAHGSIVPWADVLRRCRQRSHRI
jgi:hypothetical protein